MADFDAIYEVEEEEDRISSLDNDTVAVVHDPVIVRGAGNMTV